MCCSPCCNVFVCIMVHIFYWFWGFRLVYATGFSVLVCPHSHTELVLDSVLNLQCPALMMLEVKEQTSSMGTLFSVLHCIRKPFFLLRYGLCPLVHSHVCPWSSQSFPSDKTAGVSSRSFTVKNISNSVT